MKIKIISVFILTAFSVLIESCGLPAPSETKVNFSPVEILKSFTATDSFDENLYIFSINAYSPDNSLYFQKTFHSDNISEKINDFNLPNGQWYFYGITLHYSKVVSPNLLQHSAKCFYSSITLDGIPKEIALDIKQENCRPLLRSSNQTLPKLSFYKDHIESTTNGSNKSIKVSLLSTKMYKVNNSSDIELESKTTIVPIDPAGNSTNPCYTLPATKGVQDLYYQFPFSKSSQNIWPMAVLIEGFLDDYCSVPDPETKIVAFNAWLQPNYSINSTSLNFVAEIKHPARADGELPTEIYWTAEKKHNGQVCSDSENCVEGHFCDSTGKMICLPSE